MTNLLLFLILCILFPPLGAVVGIGFVLFVLWGLWLGRKS